MRFREVICDRSRKTIEIKINRLSGGLFSEDGELLSQWGEVTSSDLKAMQEEVAKDRAAREKYKRDSRDNDI
jgi:hypothetical protein